MAKTSFVWDGLKEFQEELRKLPEACRADAAILNDAGAKNAYTTIAAVYDAHQVTGTLRRRLTLKSVRGGLVLTSASPIAWLFDNGSQARHWKSGKSTGTMWGKTPPTHIFAKTVGRERRKLTEHFKDMLLRHGAASVTVTDGG